MDSHNEHEWRTFTPLHQQALYNLARLALIILENAENGSIEDVANTGIKLAVVAQNLLAEIDTPSAATEPAQTGRYVVRDNKHPFASEQGYMIWDTVLDDWYVHDNKIGYSYTVYAIEAEANAEADRLNAAHGNGGK